MASQRWLSRPCNFRRASEIKRKSKFPLMETLRSRCACVFDEEERAGPRESAAGLCLCLRLREMVHVIVFYTQLGSSFLF